MTLVYLEEARHELLDAVAYYEACAQGLGRRLFSEVQAGEESILGMPEAWGKVGGGFRRKLLHRFPYGLVYHMIEDKVIEIVAVMHLHRKPGYWRKRSRG